jgi:hypothetical protein
MGLAELVYMEVYHQSFIGRREAIDTLLAQSGVRRTFVPEQLPPGGQNPGRSCGLLWRSTVRLGLWAAAFAAILWLIISPS